MNLRQLPIVSTIVVLAAVATMIALGIWQLGRADEKAALIAKYEAALDAEPVALPLHPYDEFARREAIYRRASVNCLEASTSEPRSGKNARGASGWMHVVKCMPAGESTASIFEVAIGWSRLPEPVNWSGGEVSGWITPGGAVNADPPGSVGIMLRVEEPVAGLQPLAKPDPRDLPNNHLAYAGQWFFFALTALVIYFLAIRKKVSERREGED